MMRRFKCETDLKPTEAKIEAPSAFSSRFAPPDALRTLPQGLGLAPRQDRPNAEAA